MSMNWKALETWFRRVYRDNAGVAELKEAVSIEQQQIIQIVDYDEMTARKIEYEELG